MSYGGAKLMTVLTRSDEGIVAHATFQSGWWLFAAQGEPTDEAPVVVG